MKAKEDAKDEAYDAFMGNVPRCKRRCGGSQTSSETSVTTSNGSDSDLVGSDYSEDSDSRDEMEDEKEEEDLTLGDPEEDSDSRRDLDAF